MREVTYEMISKIDKNIKNPFARIFGYLSLIPIALIEDESKRDGPKNKLL